MKSSPESTLPFGTTIKSASLVQKTIGQDYTEERLNERLQEELEKPTYAVKKAVGHIIDAGKNEKAKNSPAYANWMTKHHLKTMAETIVDLRDQGIPSSAQLDMKLDQVAVERQTLQDKIHEVETTLKPLSEDMENAHVVTQYRRNDDQGMRREMER